MEYSSNPLVTALLPALVVAFATYIAYINSTQFNVKSKFYEERLKNFYFPVFIKLESKFFQKLSKEEALEVAEYLSTMCEKNRLLVNDRILDRLRLMKLRLDDDEKRNDDFSSICRHIDADLDSLQYHLGLPRRGFIYRSNNRQLTSNNFFNYNVVKEFFSNFLLPIIILFTMFYFALWLNKP
ncbi:MAG: hypothetical protein AB9858_04875 [Acidaminococcaceae bacterium]